MILAISIFGPAQAVGRAVAAEIGKAVATGIASFADWAVNGMVHAMVATTQVSFGGWFAGPWRGMLAVAALFSLPILLAGTITEILAGRPAEAARRAFIAPLQVALGVLVALAAAGLVLQLVDLACELLVQTALGADIGSAFGRIPGDLAQLTAPGGIAGAAVPALAAVLLGVAVGVAALVIWVELLVRSLLIYLVVAFIPLGLAGLFWRETARWLRRLIEFGAAVALSQLVIVAVMTLAAADLGHGTLKGGSPGADINTLLTAVGLILLGSFALPLALKVVPHAAEAALAAGSGGQILSRLGGQASPAMSEVGRFVSDRAGGQVESLTASSTSEQLASAASGPAGRDEFARTAGDPGAGPTETPSPASQATNLAVGPAALTKAGGAELAAASLTAPGAAGSGAAAGAALIV